MTIKELIAENILYPIFGCCYTKDQQPLYDFIESKIPKDFFNKEVYDIGCGDGSNTVRLKKIFKAKRITGYDHNDHLIKKAINRGLTIKKIDMNNGLPKGEMVTFTASLHHVSNKEETLRKVVKNFKYLFICEPLLDLYHYLIDAGHPLIKKDWIKLFDKTLKKYSLYQYKNFIFVFYAKEDN